MKNEEKFKVKIAEIASKIAEEMSDEKEMDEAKPKVAPAENPNKSAPIDAEKFIAKLEMYDSALTPFYNSINNAQELEVALAWLIGKMPNLTPGNGITGMRRAIDRMAKEKAAAPANSNDVPDVTPEDEKEAPMPKLQEAFNRINRK